MPGPPTAVKMGIKSATGGNETENMSKKTPCLISLQPKRSGFCSGIFDQRIERNQFKDQLPSDLEARRVFGFPRISGAARSILENRQQFVPSHGLGPMWRKDRVYENRASCPGQNGRCPRRPDEENLIRCINRSGRDDAGSVAD